MLSNTTGYGNVALGIESLLQNTTGNTNVAIGRMALDQNTTGSGNIAIGAESGNGNLGSGNNNSSYNSIFIGQGAQSSFLNVDNQIVIGAGARRKSGSNSVVLGNDNISKTSLKGELCRYRNLLTYTKFKHCRFNSFRKCSYIT